MNSTPVDTYRNRKLSIANQGEAGEMAYLDFGDPERPVDLVFAHANGFNALTYRSLLEPLADRLRIIAPDLRGHGQTRLETRTSGRWSWDDHGRDLAAFLDALEGPPVVLAGHSMGATSGLLASAFRPGRVSRLVLFDPVIWKRSAHFGFGLPLLRRLPGRIPLTRAALRRRQRFDDLEQAFKAYRGRGAFRDWPDVVLSDYLQAGLIAQVEGGLCLACAPEWEASNYAAQSHDPWRAMDRSGRPIHILKAEHQSTCFATPDPRRDRRVEVVSGGTHFFPMIRPEVAQMALSDACRTD